MINEKLKFEGSRLNQIELQRLIRKELSLELFSRGYSLTYDNEKNEGNLLSANTFKVEFKGTNKIVIYNDDWRDYTEYFRVKVNSSEIMILNIDNFDSARDAFDTLKSALFIKII